MFTGIVTDIGTVESVKDLPGGRLFRIHTAYDTETIDLGASIACAGVCLTVTAKSDRTARAFPDEVDTGSSSGNATKQRFRAFSEVREERKCSNTGWFEVEAWEEALRLTSAGHWAEGTRINTERAMKVGDEYGGHMVSGHVDGLATIIRAKAEGDATRFFIEAPAAQSKYIAPKGSVCLDGTSLTVNSVRGDIFDVLIIRHTQQITTWGQAGPGDKVNIEIDQIARYVERYISRLAEAGKEA